MSFVSTGSKKIRNSKSSLKRSSNSDSIRSKKSQYSESFSSEHGSKFGRSVSKFPKKNEPDMVQSISIINSRVIPTHSNFPVNYNMKLPDLTNLEATDCIRELGDFMEILDYEFNYSSFWLLDVLSKLIKHMQIKGLSAANQNLCLSWLRYVLRCISISGDSRETIFCLLQKMFLKAEESIKSGGEIPQPEEIEILERKSIKISGSTSGSRISSKSFQSMSLSNQSQRRVSRKASPMKTPRKSSVTSRTSHRSRSSKSWGSKARISLEEKVETNLEILYLIVEMIYNVFADRFVFSLISQSYSSPTIVTPVEIPIEFKDPKLLRPPIGVTPPVSPTSVKTSASGKKGKDKGKKKKGTAASEGAIDDGEKPKKGKGKEKGGKGKGKSKPSEVIELSDEQKEILEKQKALEEQEKIQKQQLEEKLKLFDKPIDPEAKLEKKKFEIKDKFILPLSEGVHKGYVENLIKSLIPPEKKSDESNDINNGKNDKKSSSPKEKKKESKGGKAKGKKKK